MGHVHDRTWFASALVLSLIVAGCGDDDTSPPPAGSGGQAGSGGTAGTGGTAATGGTGGGTGGVGGTGGAGGAAGSQAGMGGSGDGEWAVLIRGTLANSDIDAAKAEHDAVAQGGEAAAKAAGDFGHDAMLGTTLMGTTENGFLGIDRWNNLAGMQQFYSDPQFQQAFAGLFSSPPTVEMWVHLPEWHSWGSLTAGDAHDPHFFVVVRGRWSDADPVVAQAAHDAAAAGGQAAAEAAGDVAHVVFAGLEDPQEAFIVDIWSSSDNLEAVYTDPSFQAAFGTVFEAPPTLQVYGSTDWHQW